MTPIIQVSQIIKNYYIGKNTIEVLKGVTLDVFKNDYVALMGPSGSGKSTLMNILGCLDSPTSGTYVLNGKDVSKMDDNALAEVRNKEIGFVFQQFNLLPRLTALENVALPLVYSGMGKKERNEKAMAMLDLVNLSDRSHHKPNELSGGQSQRVAIARAISPTPKYLFFDEPNSGLDPQTAILIDNLIKEITEEYETTTVINTHDMNSVMEIGDKIIFLHKGKKWWEGSNREITSSTNNELKDFIFASKILRELVEKK